MRDFLRLFSTECKAKITSRCSLHRRVHGQRHRVLRKFPVARARLHPVCRREAAPTM